METVTIMNGIKDYWVQLAGNWLFSEVKFRDCWNLLAVQMSQAGQLTLELPYVIIGLGPTPNFVERLTVGVPPSSESVCH
jgi:hypothetical protein